MNAKNRGVQQKFDYLLIRKYCTANRTLSEIHLTLRCCMHEIYFHLHGIIRSQILTTVNIKIKVFFWDVTPSGLVAT